MNRRSTVSQSKQAERDVAEEMGGRRLHAGEWHGSGDVDVIDVALPARWVAQVKHRSGVPDYLVEGMRQVNKATANSRLLPVLVLKTKPGQGRPSQTFYILDTAGWQRVRPKEQESSGS